MGTLFKIHGLIIAKTQEKLIVLIGSKENCITSRSNLNSHDLLHCQWLSGIKPNKLFSTGDGVIASGYVLQYNNQRMLKLTSLKHDDNQT